MNYFDLDQAQQRFPELVARARRGEDIIITERNQPVVKFVAVEQGMKASEGCTNCDSSSCEHDCTRSSNEAATATWKCQRACSYKR